MSSLRCLCLCSELLQMVLPASPSPGLFSYPATLRNARGASSSNISSHADSELSCHPLETLGRLQKPVRGEFPRPRDAASGLFRLIDNTHEGGDDNCHEHPRHAVVLAVICCSTLLHHLSFYLVWRCTFVRENSGHTLGTALGPRRSGYALARPYRQQRVAREALKSART